MPSFPARALALLALFVASASARARDASPSRGPRRRLSNLETSVVLQTGGFEADPGGGGAGSTGGSSSSSHPLWDAGLTGAGQLLGVGDSGLDVSSCFLADPSGAPPGPTHRKVAAYVSGRFGDRRDGNGHGTHVVATACGRAAFPSDPEVERAAARYDGVAPDARVVFTDLGVGDGGVLYLPGSVEEYYGAAYRAGARVHSDSWGNDAPAYDALAAEVDAYAHARPDFLPIFAAGNFGDFSPFFFPPGGGGGVSTVTSPGTAKNALSVGASLGWSGPGVFERDDDARRAAAETFEMIVTVERVTEPRRGVRGGEGVRGERRDASRAKKTLGRARVFLASSGPRAMPPGPIPLVEADPPDACAPLISRASDDANASAGSNSSLSPRGGPSSYVGAAALVSRGGCPFSEKIRRARDAGAVAAIVANDRVGGFFVMGAEGGAPPFPIAAASAPLSTGRKLRAALARTRAAAAASSSAGSLESDGASRNASALAAFVSFRHAEVSPRRVDHIAAFSSFGPTADGRVKPDLVAPGEIVSAAAASASASATSFSFAAEAEAEAEAEAVFPPGSGSGPGSADPGSALGTCRVTRVGGTSMATPAAAGAALLVRQYFLDGFYPGGESDPTGARGFEPSAALVRATLVNGAEPMRGFTERGLPLEPPPSIRQGFGRVNAGRSLPLKRATGSSSSSEEGGTERRPTSVERLRLGLPADAMFAANVRGGRADAIRATGDAREYCVEVITAPASLTAPPRESEEGDAAAFESSDERARELRVTLAWTDPPPPFAAAGANPTDTADPALVNDLDLEVRRVFPPPAEEAFFWAADGFESAEGFDESLDEWSEDADVEALADAASGAPIGWAPRDRANTVERVVAKLRPSRRNATYAVKVWAHAVRWARPEGQAFAIAATGPGLREADCDAARRMGDRAGGARTKKKKKNASSSAAPEQKTSDATPTIAPPGSPGARPGSGGAGSGAREAPAGREGVAPAYPKPAPARPPAAPPRGGGGRRCRGWLRRLADPSCWG